VLVGQQRAQLRLVGFQVQREAVEQDIEVALVLRVHRRDQHQHSSEYE
jgi:hypothetical protein